MKKQKASKATGGNHAGPTELYQTDRNLQLYYLSGLFPQTESFKT